MSKELLISLLENGIKKTIDRLDNSQTNEMNSLKLLTNHMSSIKSKNNIIIIEQKHITNAVTLRKSCLRN